MSTPSNPAQLLDLTGKIICAYVGNNSITSEQLPTVIRNVYSTLSTTEKPPEIVQPKPEPACNPKKSVFNDFIICLEDGSQLKMLKRYLMAKYNMTPDQYRRRWGLDDSYPMVAPAYSKTRSDLAKKIGLGTKGELPGPTPAPVQAAPTKTEKVATKKPKAKANLAAAA